ncbi:MAG: hypothetical protein ACR2HJ_07330 [Fimbriimonadales bacterium]
MIAVVVLFQLLIGQAQVQTTEVSLGLTTPGQAKYSFAVSPDGNHIAFTDVRGGKECVVADGVPGTLYDSIPRAALTEAGIQDQITFSPDSRDVAYVARKGPKYVVVRKGGEGKVYDHISIGAPTFSPDGKRLAYFATRGKQEFCVSDGVEGRGFDSVDSFRPMFSPDSKRLLYRSSRGGKAFAVVDGVEVPEADYHGHPDFGGDGGRTYDVAKVGDKWVVWIDGKPSRPYDGVGNNIVFSPDYKRVLHRASDGTGSFLVVDGKESKRHGPISENSYKFTPGGKVVFVVRQAAGSFVVIDDVAGDVFDWVSDPVFSHDGSSTAFVAEKSLKRFVVHDGKRSQEYTDVGMWPRFAPAGRRLVYSGKLAGENLVVDGIAKSFEAVRTAQFSHDGRRLAVVAREGGVWSLYVDGVKGPAYDSDQVAVVFSPDSKKLASVGPKGKGVVLVEDGAIRGEFDDSGFMDFDPGSRNLCMLAKRDDKWFPVIGGVEGKRYDSLVWAGVPSIDASGAFSFLAMKGEEYLRVTVKRSPSKN